MKYDGFCVSKVYFCTGVQDPLFRKILSETFLQRGSSPNQHFYLIALHQLIFTKNEKILEVSFWFVLHFNRFSG